ncbi:MAG: bifunctional precorrin-2 dehydrogenase/sirohydrochlorin ferrochelatase [Nitrospirae bacterium]|nr:bifunctional precorrin-2 dehydrogenase/sirohydrochlorin ferrochelatase [Magnetococcales bacterium]
MKDAFLPLFLDLKDRACLLVGSGEEAIRKGSLLLNAGACLRLVSPEGMAHSWPEDFQGRIRWCDTVFHPHHLDGIWLVVSTHLGRSVNEMIRKEAENRGIFVNVVDQPEFCSAIWPALISRPPVSVAISTGGTGPALSGWLRQRISERLPDDLGEMAQWFAHWRKMMASEFSSLEQRGDFWKGLFSDGLLDRFLSGDRVGAEQMIRDAAAIWRKKMSS